MSRNLYQGEDLKVKIEDTNVGNIHLSHVLKRISKGKKGIEFESVLRKTGDRNYEQISSQKSGESNAATLENLQHGEIAPIVKFAERLLNTLDEYRQKLKDTSVPLKDIKPLIERLERERNSLTPAIQSLSNTDGLKSILYKTIEFSSQEILRFKRGDYSIR